MRIALALLCLALTGCATNRQPEQTPPPKAPTAAEVGTLVKGHHQREAVQFQAAERINLSVTGLAVEADVREQTGVIVQANRDASAQQIDDMAAAFLRATATFDTRHAEDQKTIAALRAENERLKDAEMRATAASLRKWGISLVLIGTAVALAAKLIPLGATIGAAGFLLLAAAQIWVRVASHPYFDLTAGALIVGILSAGVWAVVHAYKKGDLTQKALREKDRLTETLKVIVPVIDDAKQQLGDAFKPTLAKLKGEMDWEDRQVIKRIRAEAEV